MLFEIVPAHEILVLIAFEKGHPIVMHTQLPSWAKYLCIDLCLLPNFLYASIKGSGETEQKPRTQLSLHCLHKQYML